MKIIRLFLFILLFLAVLFAAALMFYEPAQAANYPLEIIQPRAGQTNANRFYKAYPGIEYNVKVAVIGGAWPFAYSLIGAPSGMTINTTTGVISWPNPSASATCAPNPGPGCNLTAKVTDAEGTVDSVSWTITVTSSGFIFVDSTNGTNSSCNGGNNSAGTLAQPFKSIADWYCGTTTAAKGNSTYKDYFVIYRVGTYTITAPNPQDGNRMQLNYQNKPMVHMAYPGETVYFDMSSGGATGWHTDNSSKNFYVDRINFINNPNLVLWVGANGSNADNVTVRRSSFSHINDGSPSCGSNNRSAIFTEVPATFYATQYYSFTENTFSNLNSSYGVLIYQYNKILVADNTFSSITDTCGGEQHTIGFKGAPRMFFARNNQFTSVAGDSIDVLYANGTNNDTRDGEISYNKILQSSGKCVHINADGYQSGGPIYIFRNTCVGGQMVVETVTASNGPFRWLNNVVINSVATIPYKIECTSGTYPAGCYANSTRFVVSGTLAGTSTSQIVDVNGDLCIASTQSGCGSTSYSSYLGNTGYQLYGSVKKPNPPTNARIQ